MHVEFCVSLDHYACSQPQIERSTGMGMDSFEADGVENAKSCSDSFESLQMALKQSGQF